METLRTATISKDEEERTQVLEIVQEPILDQAKKSIGRMPWHQEPKKDAVNCEKPWGAVSEHRSTDIRMGKPGAGNAASRLHECIVQTREPGELKHLSSRRKRKKHRFS